MRATLANNFDPLPALLLGEIGTNGFHIIDSSDDTDAAEWMLGDQAAAHKEFPFVERQYHCFLA